MIFAGVDIGSSSAQTVLLSNENIIASASMIAKPAPELSARCVMAAALSQAGTRERDIVFCISTGYGREKISFASDTVSEISCIVKGAFWLNPSTRTVIDIGAQDNKVISVTPDGRLNDFIMNDKCAAGSGRFLEKIAGTFGLQISEFGALALSADKPAPIQNNCPVYVNFDALSCMSEGWTKASIALSAVEILCKRLMNASGRIKIQEQVCITGGVAKNKAVMKSLQRNIGIPILQLPVDPQIVGALGAAVFAKERYHHIIKQRQESTYAM